MKQTSTLDSHARSCTFVPNQRKQQKAVSTKEFQRYTSLVTESASIVNQSLFTRQFYVNPAKFQETSYVCLPARGVLIVITVLLLQSLQTRWPPRIFDDTAKHIQLLQTAPRRRDLYSANNTC